LFFSSSVLSLKKQKSKIFFLIKKKNVHQNIFFIRKKDTIKKPKPQPENTQPGTDNNFNPGGNNFNPGGETSAGGNQFDFSGDTTTERQTESGPGANIGKILLIGGGLYLAGKAFKIIK
jgi:hypothetical protein